MKRRQILGAVAAVATGTTVTGILGSKNNKKQVIKKDTKVCMPNISKGVKRFRMVTTWPKDFPGLGQMPSTALLKH